MAMTNRDPLVSIVMAAYNARPYIAEAIRSALEQTHRDLELIIVNDGSTDDTRAVIEGFSDPRIVLIDQLNGGIGKARNTALERVNGDFVCFLDADDVLPPNSLKVRLELLLHDPGLSFSDGTVVFKDRELTRVLRKRVPSFTGQPLQLLAVFDPACFFGNTWMIRWEKTFPYRFEPAITHVEDLLFYLNMAQGRRYDHTTEPVLFYRITGHSSMTKLEGLENSYLHVNKWMRTRTDLFAASTVRRNLFLVHRMMSGAYWRSGRPLAALKAWFRQPQWMGSEARTER
jgi:glycosyltransferase involved in cell wall biosynthesis